MQQWLFVQKSYIYWIANCSERGKIVQKEVQYLMMAWKETFSSSTIALKVCLVLAPLQALIYIVGFSTNYWVSADVISIETGTKGQFGSQILNALGLKLHSGLWGSTQCILDVCNSGEHQMSAVPDWLHVTRLFASLGLIGILATIVGVLVCLFVTSLSQRRILHVMTAAVAAGTGFCVLVAVAIYGTHYNNPDRALLTADKDPSWSYGLCVAALVLDIITAILLGINALRKPAL